MNFSFFQNVFKVIQTLVFKQGTKSVHFSFVGMPLCSQKLELFPVVQHFFNVTCCYSSLFISLTFWYTSVIKSEAAYFIRRLTSRCLERKQPSRVGGSPLCDVVSSFLCHIQTEKISSWNGPTVHVCCFMLARASTKTFVSRIHIR